jgi:hypothetical protein
MLLAGAACQRASIRVGPRVIVPGLVLFVIGQVVGPVHVLQDELVKSPYANTDLWSPPPVAVLGLLIALASVLIWVGASAIDRGNRKSAAESAEESQVEPAVEEVTHAT